MIQTQYPGDTGRGCIHALREGNLAMRPLDLIFQIQAEVTRPYRQPVMTNTHCSGYVEAMAGVVLASSGWRRNEHWDPWDLVHSESGCYLEVKQSSAAWPGGNATSPPRFDIKRRSHGHPADIYIFAWHPHPLETVDQRDPAEWEFFVIAEQELPDRKTIGLEPLRRLTTSCSIEELASAVETIRVTL